MYLRFESRPDRSILNIRIMKKVNTKITFTSICLSLAIIVSSSVVIYKTFFRINIMPNATGILIDEKINYAKQSVEINDLKQFIISEFKNKEVLIRENDHYINIVFLLGITIFTFAVLGLILSFILMKRLKVTT